MGRFLSLLATFCQPQQAAVTPGLSTEAEPVVRDKDEDKSNRLQPSTDGGSSIPQSLVSRVPSNTKRSSQGRRPSDTVCTSDHKEHVTLLFDDGIGIKLFNQTNRDCKEPGEFQVDIIAIHGLDGHRENTWKDKQDHQQSAEDQPLWLRDFLPADLPGSRIFTYGYNSKVLGSSSVSHIDSFAEQLLQGLHINTSDHQVRQCFRLETKHHLYL